MNLLIAALMAAAQGQIPFATIDGGLTAFPGQAVSDVLPGGTIAFGCSAGVGHRSEGGTTCLAELSACSGLHGGFEAGLEVPVWLADRDRSGHALGDLTLSGKYLYEEARGGTALSFTGRLRLPTGSIPRDRGSEAAAGFCTSTTYRLFRFSASAEYALDGGGNPFQHHIDDSGHFGFGGTSFVSPDLEAFASLYGSTLGSMSAACGVVFSPVEDLFVFLQGSAALQGNDGTMLRAGISMTTER